MGGRACRHARRDRRPVAASGTTPAGAGAPEVGGRGHTAPFLYNPRKKKLVSLVARPGVVPYERYINNATEGQPLSVCVGATSDKSGGGGCGLVGIGRRFPKCHHARLFFASPATSAPCSSQPQPYTPGASSSRPLAWFYLQIFLSKVSRRFCVARKYHTKKSAVFDITYTTN